MDDKTGGLVFEPKFGMHEWIWTPDFKKMYPNIYRQFNAGPETKISKEESEKLPREKYNITPHGIYFLTEPKSINCRVYEKLLDLRSKWQKIANQMKHDHGPMSDIYNYWYQKQFRAKNMTNTRFGITGLKSDRTYDVDVFNTATKTGQHFVKFIAITILVEELGYEIIYGDTDSCMVKLKSTNLPDCIKESERLENHINSRLVDEVKKFCPNPEKILIRVEGERICRRFLAIKKKKYGMYVVYEDGEETDYIMWKGIERVRRDTSVLVENTQDLIGRLVMSGNMTNRHKMYITRRIEKIISKIKIMPLTTVCQRCSSSETLEEFEADNERRRKAGEKRKNMTMDLRAIVYSKKYVGLRIGRRADCKLVVDRDRSPIGKRYPDQIQGKNFALAMDEEDIDYVLKEGFVPLYWYYEDQLISKVGPFLKVMGIDWDVVKKRKNMCDPNDI